MKTIAIIPARGGSKGIPRKNLIPIAGKPLIYYSIRHALESECIDRVIVSTEDEEIAEVAKSFGAEVPFMRSSDLAGDDVLDWPVFAHALEELYSKENYNAELVVHLRPTAPYRKIGWIDEAIKLLKENPNADSVRSVSAVEQHPYRMFKIGLDGFLDPIMDHLHPEPYLLRRQDLPAYYYYNCVIDVTRSSTIKIMKSMTGKKLIPYLMNRDEVIDLDTPLDLEILNNVFIKKL